MDRKSIVVCNRVACETLNCFLIIRSLRLHTRSVCHELIALIVHILMLHVSLPLVGSATISQWIISCVTKTTGRGNPALVWDHCGGSDEAETLQWPQPCLGLYFSLRHGDAVSILTCKAWELIVVPSERRSWLLAILRTSKWSTFFARYTKVPSLIPVTRQHGYAEIGNLGSSPDPRVHLSGRRHRADSREQSATKLGYLDPGSLADSSLSALHCTATSPHIKLPTFYSA